MKSIKRIIASLAVAGLCFILPACGSLVSDDTQTAIDTFVASVKAQIESGGFDADTLETQLKAVVQTIPAEKRVAAEAAIRSGVKAICDYRVSNGAMTQANEDALLAKYDAAVVKVEAWIASSSAHAAAVSKTAMRK